MYSLFHQFLDVHPAELTLPLSVKDFEFEIMSLISLEQAHNAFASIKGSGQIF